MDKEERVKFQKGKQRKFFELVVTQLSCVSIRGILQFGIDIPYSTLKNYYTERRLLPRSLFENLCHIAKIDANNLKVDFLNGNFGQVKGGRKKKS